MSIGGTALEAIGIGVTIVAAWQAVEWARGKWRSGPGARRTCQRRVEQVSVGITSARCEELLGMGSPSHRSTAMRADDGAVFTARLFQTTWCSVELVTDAENVVRRFSVWSRHTRFRPTFRAGEQWPRLDITMRSTVLEQMGQPVRVDSYVGAQTAAYIEEHYYGRPGSYRYYHAGFNEASMFDATLPDNFSAVLTSYELNTGVPDQLPPEVAEFRRRNALAVYGESDGPWRTFAHPIGPSLVETWAIRERVTRAVKRRDRRLARQMEKDPR